MESKTYQQAEEGEKEWKSGHKASKGDFEDEDAKRSAKNEPSASKGWDEEPERELTESKRRFEEAIKYLFVRNTLSKRTQPFYLKL